MRYKFLFFILMMVWVSCADEDNPPVSPSETLQNIIVPAHFPEITFPEQNNFSPDRWSLGKKLFYDKRLSVDSTISCASCHKPSYAFADNTSMTSGVFGRQGVTNSPSLANVAYHPYYTREGGVPTLEMQVLVPVSEHNEFGFNIVEIVKKQTVVPVIRGIILPIMNLKTMAFMKSMPIREDTDLHKRSQTLLSSKLLA
ncbi:MAG: cytochrome-c peroxidase [Saprospiraceae bacterium]|nr:cytochrome-c peroxidase [Saprospiraceae bacterium]